jgi:NAD-dependent deacetylase
MNDTDISAAAALLRGSKKTVVLTGAGISAESGIPTFRGEDGLWNRFRAEDLATLEAFREDAALVWGWYDWRRGLMSKVEPNPAHKVLALWERRLPGLSIVTQNIDGLHQKAGSKSVVELHGNIWRVRCTKERTVSANTEPHLEEIPPRCPSCGALLRPDVVWFGEPLERAVLEEAVRLSATCEVMVVVGTSALVHPAASLPMAALERGARLIEINPDSTPLTRLAHLSLRGKAGEVLPLVQDRLGIGPGEDGQRSRT